MARCECPVDGGYCDKKLCSNGPGCTAEADRILNLPPEEMEAAIQCAAVELKLDPELFAQYLHGLAFGTGSEYSTSIES